MREEFRGKNLAGFSSWLGVGSEGGASQEWATSSEFRRYLARQGEKAMAPHSSTLAWQIPWMEEPGRLQSMGSWRVGHDWATSLSLSCTREGNSNPLQCSCLENPRDGRAWWATVYGVAQSWTWLKRLSSSSNSQRRNTAWQREGSSS